MNKTDTSIVIENITINLQDVQVCGNVFELALPPANNKSQMGRLSLALAIIKTMEVVAPGIPAVVDFIKKAA